MRYGASIGAGSVIVSGVTIGRWAMVGAGSSSRRDVPDQALVKGNPARVTGYVCECGQPLEPDRQSGRRQVALPGLRRPYYDLPPLTESRRR